MSHGMDPVVRDTGCDDPGRPRPATYASSAYVTDEMWYLWEALEALEPGTQLGGIYANKPGYHNCRSQLPASDYSVEDQPPDGGGPGDKAAALDWTFPEAQRGDYTRIAKYTSRLLDSARDPADHRLDGWREFYGQSDWDSSVEGWDCRYGYAATSDSSHLWHIHLSENRDQTTSKANKDALLSVLYGETVEEWEDDVTAKDVWSYDVDPSALGYTAGGSLWTVYNRTAYLSNDFAPQVSTALNEIDDRLAALEASVAGSVYSEGAYRATSRALSTLLVLAILAVVIAAVGLGLVLTE